jgi:hypothetical protein
MRARRRGLARMVSTFGKALSDRVDARLAFKAQVLFDDSVGEVRHAVAFDDFRPLEPHGSVREGCEERDAFAEEHGDEVDVHGME